MDRINHLIISFPKNLVKKFIKTQNKVNQETEWKLKNSNIKILIWMISKNKITKTNQIKINFVHLTKTNLIKNFKKLQIVKIFKYNFIVKRFKI